MIQVLSPESSALVESAAQPGTPPLLVAGVLAFLGWPLTLPVLAVSGGASAAVLLRLRSRDFGFQNALVVVCFGSLAAYLLLLLSFVSIGASEPEWWETACVAAGWIVGLGVLGALNSNSSSSSASAGWAGLLAGVISGYASRYLLQYVLGPWLIFPLIKYVLGYLLSFLAPVALLCVWGAVLFALFQSGAALRWLVIPFGFFVCVSVAVLTGPVWIVDVRDFLSDALLALAPCAAALVVVGFSPGLKTCLACSAALYSWVASLLAEGSSSDSAAVANRLGVSLVSAPVALAFSALLPAAIAWHMFRTRGGQWRSALRDDSVARFLLVVMPWLCLVPAFYFARVGDGVFVLFALGVLVLGLLLVAGAAWPVGRFRLASAGGGSVRAQARMHELSGRARIEGSI